jgi:hypothetical protein
MLGQQGVPLGPDGQPLQQRASRWEVFMNGINGLMHFFGRVSFLVDENAHAVHFFVTALLQMLDRAGYLYGGRAVLRPWATRRLWTQRGRPLSPLPLRC